MEYQESRELITVESEIGEEPVVYGSDMINLTDVDLEALSEIPAPVLRKAIIRMRNELCGNSGESSIYAEFRSSLPGRSAEPPGSSTDMEDPDNDQKSTEKR